MHDPHVARALGLSAEPTGEEIGERFRTLIGLSPPPADPALWVRFLQAIEIARTLRPDGPRGDSAELAHFTVGYAIVRDGEPDHERFGLEAWDRELGVGFTESDDVLRELVIDEIGPRLARAGLFTLL